MGHRFAEIAFTPAVRAVQSAAGSRDGYAGMDTGGDHNHRLGEAESAFIAARDSFYMASVGETGWPYVQHRGGPAGFMKILDAGTLGFADYSGNRQYISVGNFGHDDRVALFFMDYVQRRRLKLLGRVTPVPGDDPDTLARLEDDDYRAPVERGFLIHVEAFDWNCPQHITPRYTRAEMAALQEDARGEKGTVDVPRSPGARQSPIGRGQIPLVVSGIRQLTPRVRAFELRDPEGGALPAVAAGAHLRIPIRLGNGEEVLRPYSIASSPERRDTWEIAVLRGADGGGSSALHAGFDLGTRLQVARPANHFALHGDDRPAVLIAGGIGITPIRAMALALNARGTPFELHYAGRRPAEMAYRDDLAGVLGSRMGIYPADSGGRLDVRAVMDRAAADAVFYTCGPAPLMDAVLAVGHGAGIAPERLRFERFAADVADDARPVGIELARSGRTIDVAADETILDALLHAGVDLPYSCKAGQCRSCAVEVLAGEPAHRDTVLDAAEREHLMCPCVSRAKTDRLVLAL
ncbi:MAG TPA: 2Fe-2S iron-sulfur cluster-binding protein [Pseudohaliea sp.]|nr:2Fe-2S iron-sulfur cluster-binding protein [Pseudohaliea sp.]